MSSLNTARPHAAVVIAYLGIGLIPILRHQGAEHKGMRLLPNYFKTLGEGPVRERMPIVSIDPLTSQSTALNITAQPLSHDSVYSCMCYIGEARCMITVVMCLELS